MARVALTKIQKQTLKMLRSHGYPFVATDAKIAWTSGHSYYADDRTDVPGWLKRRIRHASIEAHKQAMKGGE